MARKITRSIHSYERYRRTCVENGIREMFHLFERESRLWRAGDETFFDSPVKFIRSNICDYVEKKVICYTGCMNAYSKRIKIYFFSRLMWYLQFRSGIIWRT